MPGHNPAGTTPPMPPLTAATGSADVIAIAGRRGHLRAVEEAPMTGADPTPAAEAPDQRLTTIIQALYIDRGMSLSDPETADAYGIALEAVVLLLDGTYQTGGIGEAEHRRLRALMDAARLVPGYLTGSHG